MKYFSFFIFYVFQVLCHRSEPVRLEPCDQLQEKSSPINQAASKYGAPGRDRTGDLRVTNALLCQLSHGSTRHIISSLSERVNSPTIAL